MKTNLTVYSITASFCDWSQIFVESLLTSGRHEDVTLAGKMIESSRQEASEPDYSLPSDDDDDDSALGGGGVDKVSYARAVELVLRAAREYFDSSASLADANMDLARSVSLSM